MQEDPRRPRSDTRPRTPGLPCRADQFERVGQFEGFLSVESRDEAALMEAVFTLGPVAVAVDAGGWGRELLCGGAQDAHRSPVRNRGVRGRRLCQPAFTLGPVAVTVAQVGVGGGTPTRAPSVHNGGV